jgi:hypothetical protein
MTTRNFVFASLAGALAGFIMEFVLYGVALAGFFAANAGAATGVAREQPVFVAVALGQIPLAIVLVLLISRWGVSPSMLMGAKVGALFGFLIELGFDLTMYGTTNISNLTATVVDPFVTLVQGTVAGAVIGLVLARLREPAAG